MISSCDQILKEKGKDTLLSKLLPSLLGIFKSQLFLRVFATMQRKFLIGKKKKNETLSGYIHSIVKELLRKKTLTALFKCTAVWKLEAGDTPTHTLPRFRSIFPKKNNSKNIHISIYRQKFTCLLHVSIFKFLCVYWKGKSRRKSDWEKCWCWPR